MSELTVQKQTLRRIEKSIDPKLVVIAKGWVLARTPSDQKVLALRKNVKGTLTENNFRKLMEKMLKIEHLTGGYTGVPVIKDINLEITLSLSSA